MIESIKLTNYQVHEHLSIKLDPQITTIVGPSDVGKSAVLRALRWVCLGLPRGGSFVREGAPEASVSVRVDGHKIKRTKGTKNTYQLDGHTFHAIGTSVPSEVSHILNVDPLSFQRQHDAPFWFGDSPGEVGRKLNAIVDLGVIDTTLGNLASMIRKARAEHRVIKDRLKGTKAEKRDLRHFQAAHDALRAIESLEGDTSRDRLRASRLTLLLREGESHRVVAEKRVEVISASGGLTHLEALDASYKRSKDRAWRLRRDVGIIRDNLQLIRDLREGVARAQKEYKKMMGKETTCPLCGSKVIQS